jgi:hypothetical protein
MSLQDSPSGLAVLAALLALRGRPARLAPELAAALPVWPTPTIASDALAAALVETAGTRVRREGAETPAARFLHRYRRRARPGPTVGEPQRPTPPFGAWRGASLLPPSAVETLAAAEADRAEAATKTRLAAARALRLEVRRLGETRRRLAVEGAAAAQELALALAERLVGETLAAGPDRLAAWVVTELAAGGPGEPVCVRVAPDAVDAVTAALETAAAQCIVCADAALSAGDVVLDTARGRRDGRVRTRLLALLMARGAPE